jgi:hypothetical protein
VQHNCHLLFVCPWLRHSPSPAPRKCSREKKRFSVSVETSCRKGQNEFVLPLTGCKGIIIYIWRDIGLVDFNNCRIFKKLSLFEFAYFLCYRVGYVCVSVCVTVSYLPIRTTPG